MDKEEEQKLAISESFQQHDLNNNVNEFLNAPFEEFLQGYTENITLQENLSVPINELKQKCREKNIGTVKDLLAGFGFNRYQVFLNGEEKLTISLPSNNLYHSELRGRK